MPTLTIFLSVVIIFYNIHYAHSQCSSLNTTCGGDESGLFCSGIVATLSYPNPLDSFRIVTFKSRSYNCNSKEYCKWGLMWNTTCITASINQNMPVYFYDTQSGTCSYFSFPIELNTSVSCCDNIKDCSQVFDDMYSVEDYSKTYCNYVPSLTALVQGVANCYATQTFLQYLQCNQTDYLNSCPLFLFSQLKEYATCACSQIYSIDQQYDQSDSYKYFRELTSIIEQEMQSFGRWEDNCPDWEFSCDINGDAFLDVYQIVCPIDITNYNNDALKQLETDISNGLYSQMSIADEQVTIYDEYDKVRILVYSEYEAYRTLDYVWSNDSEPELNGGIGCTLSKVLWNINELYPDYIETSMPTVVPTVIPSIAQSTESGSTFVNDDDDDGLMIALIVIFLLLFIFCILFGYIYWKRKKKKVVNEMRVDDIQLVNPNKTNENEGMLPMSNTSNNNNTTPPRQTYDNPFEDPDPNDGIPDTNVNDVFAEK